MNVLNVDIDSDDDGDGRDDHAFADVSDERADGSQ